MLPLTVGGGPVTGGALRPTSALAPFFFFDVLLSPLTLTTWPMGVIFTCVQAYEYHHILHEHLFFNEEAVNSGLYGSIFFMATGFHGFHVLIGTIFLAVCLIRLLAGDFTPQKHFGFEAAAWYWHFVDVVWLFLFVSVQGIYLAVEHRFHIGSKFDSVVPGFPFR